MSENEPRDEIDEEELRRLEGDARERMGLSRVLPTVTSMPTRGVSIPWTPRTISGPSPEEIVRREIEDTERRKHSRLDRAARAVPARYSGLTLSSPALARRVRSLGAVSDAVKAAVAQAPGMTLMGPTGSGKTTLACAALADFLLAHGGAALFAPARDLASARAHHALGEGEPALVERAIRSDILILDDLGIEEQATRSAVGDVIDERYDRNLVTWITTGFDVGFMATRYGSGRARRLFEDPIAVIRLGGK